MSNFEFQVIKNGLHRKSAMKALEIENEYYRAILFYFGDYTKDKEQNHISQDNISITCTSKSDNLDLICHNTNIAVSAMELSFIPIEQIDKSIEKLNIAKQSATALRNIIKTYF